MSTKVSTEQSRGFFGRSRQKTPPLEDAAVLQARLVGSIRKEPRIRRRAELPTFRSTITQSHGVVGNDLSEIAVLDLGNREALVLVSEGKLGQRLHLDLRSRLLEANYSITVERLADISLIVDINKAINGAAADKKASDARSIVEELINAAVEDQATDIHLCCRDTTGMALFRVHSRMYPYQQYSSETCSQMAGYLYSQMSDPKTRSDNTFSMEKKSLSCIVTTKIKGSVYKLRYKYIRMVDGWDLIVRLLPTETHNQVSKTFSDLGYEVSQNKLLTQCVSRTIGLILFLGPTGSGKSTALKASMEADPNRMQRKRYSVEDPVEYKIFGVSQISVQRDDHEDSVDSIKALNGTLRDILRGDPDDIMVGETRDASTTSIVADFVMTGHKVYTTLHTSSGFGAILRLHRLGLDRALLGDKLFLSALVFQRLMPVLCEHCKVPAAEVLSAGKLQLMQEKFGLDTSSVFCSALGDCQHCKGRGISGSTVVAEVIPPDTVMRRLIAEGKDADAELYWRKSRGDTRFDDADMTGKTAYEHAIYKISQGWIDPRDLEREFESLESYELTEGSA
ncbi:GspE/PulE family protein [Pseudomonas viridiflava]|uniref:GspE/PulE family protein n=1 Tax=Pseudomonas viridiflava TaxID=33069 RepID=UPI000F05C497|nr:ATPase, T2SS/T4P/T4SS family [Pseudomonas viridiflava]